MDPVATVRGEAQLEGPPDLAGLSVTIHSSAAARAAVQADLAAASEAVRAVATRVSDALERWSTGGLHISPVFDDRSGTRVTGYRGSMTTSIVVADLDAVSDVLIAFGDVPNSQVDGPWWSLRRDNPLHRQVRLAAIEDARQRAADYAAAFDRTVGDLIEVSDLDGTGSGGPRSMMAMAVGAESAFDVEPATQTVSASVTVRFALT